MTQHTHISYHWLPILSSVCAVPRHSNPLQGMFCCAGVCLASSASCKSKFVRSLHSLFLGARAVPERAHFLLIPGAAGRAGRHSRLPLAGWRAAEPERGARGTLSSATVNHACSLSAFPGKACLFAHCLVIKFDASD